MSATRDQSQKFTFVYSNLYHLYKKGKDAAKNSTVPPAFNPEKTASPISAPHSEMTRGVLTGKIIKADDFSRPEAHRISRHEPPRFIAKKIVANRPLRVHPEREKAIHGLRENMKQPRSLQERLHFMLKELEDLTKE